MTVLIVYASYYGSTERCAYKIKEKIKVGTSVISNISFNDVTNLSDYDKIIIGTPIHINRIHKSIKKFLEKNIDELSKKDLYFFCCGFDEEWINNLHEHIPEKLYTQVRYKTCFGGEIVKDKLSGFEKVGIEMMEKKLNIDYTNHKTIDEKKIDAFIEFLDKA